MPGRYHPFRHINLLAICASEPLTVREARDRLSDLEGGFRLGLSTVQMMIIKQHRDGLLDARSSRRQFPNGERPAREYTLSHKGESELAALSSNLERFLC